MPPRSVGVLRAPTPRTDLTHATRASAHAHARMHARACARKCTRADACARLSFASNSSCRLSLSRRMSAATCTPCGARRISRRTARADAAQHNGQTRRTAQRTTHARARIDRQSAIGRRSAEADGCGGSWCRCALYGPQPLRRHHWLGMWQARRAPHNTTYNGHTTRRWLTCSSRRRISRSRSSANFRRLSESSISLALLASSCCAALSWCESSKFVWFNCKPQCSNSSGL